MKNVRTALPGCAGLPIWLLAILLMPISDASGTSYTPAWKTSLLGITYWVPPMTAFLEDSEGRKLGNDPSGTVSADGEGPRIEQIPLSALSVHNEGNEESPEMDAPSPSAWVLKLFDGESASYNLHVQGLADAIATIKIRLSIRGRSGSSRIAPIKKDLLVAPGSRYLLVIRSDGVQGQLIVDRRVPPSGLKTSVEIAFRLGMIPSKGLYQSLYAKADAISSAADRGRDPAIRGLVKAFLNEVSAQTEKHLSKRAANMLREEAEALLSPPSRDTTEGGKSKVSRASKVGR